MVDRTEFVVTFQAKDKGLSSQLQKTGRSGKEAGKKIEEGFKRAKRSSDRFGGGLSLLKTKLLGIGAVIGSAFAARQALQGALKFSNAIAEVGTIAGVSADELKRLRGETLDIATSLGLDEVNTAQGLYQTLSAGITDTTDALAVLGSASRLAVAGVSTTSETVDLLTSVINAYGFEASKADDLSDKLFETVRLGKTTISELAANIGQVAPIASATGVAFEQLTAAIATSTLAGLSTSEASTQIKSAITALGKKTKEIRELFNAAGKEFEFTDIKTRGLVPVLQDLRDVLGDDTEALINLLGRQEAVNAVFNLTGRNLETYNDILRQTGEAQDSVGKALTQQFASAGGRIEAYFNAINQGLVELGLSFIESLGGDAPESVEEFSQSLLDLRENIAQFSPLLNALGTAAQGVAVTLNTAAAAFKFAVAEQSFTDISETIQVFGETAPKMERLAVAVERLGESSELALRAYSGFFEFVGNTELADRFRLQAEFEVWQSDIEKARKVAREAREEAKREALKEGGLLNLSTGLSARRADPADSTDLFAGSSGERRNKLDQLVQEYLASQEKIKQAQDALFNEERIALINSISATYDEQRESIDDLIDKQFERVNALLASEEVTAEQGETLKDYIDTLEAEAIATLDAADAAEALKVKREELKDNSRILGGELQELIALQKESDVSTPLLDELLAKLRGEAKTGDVPGFKKLSELFKQEVDAAGSLGRQFSDAFNEGLTTARDAASQLGTSLSDSLTTYLSTIGRASGAWDQFKEAAFSAIDAIVRRLLASEILKLLDFGLDFAFGSPDPVTPLFDTSVVNPFAGPSFAQGGVQSFASGGVTGGAFAGGGIATSPTVTVFGDQSGKFKGEAFVPIPGDARGIPVEFRGPPQPTASQGGGDVLVTFNVEAIDAKSFNERLAEGSSREMVVSLISDAMDRSTGFRQQVKSVAASS